MATVKPITGRQAGELCRLLEERGVDGDEFQQGLVERPDEVVIFIRGEGSAVAAPKRRWELVAFLEEGESPITAQELAKRARELRANDTRQDAEYLLTNQEEIPAEARDLVLVFPGWRVPDGFVAGLSWYGERWGHDFDWVECDFGSDDRLVRVCE